jgi:hypothetical protein
VDGAEGAGASAFTLEGVETTGSECGVLLWILVIADMGAFVELWRLPYASVSAT